MQKKHTKGLFIHTSYKRAGLLKTLLHGFRHDPNQADSGDGPYDYGLRDQETSVKGIADSECRADRLKRAASL